MLRILDRNLGPFLRKRILTRFPGSIRVNGEEITDLGPLGYRTPGRTRAGRISMIGSWRGSKVKIYTAHNVQHAKFRIALNDFCAGNICFPEVVLSQGELIVERWIDGSSVSSLDSAGRESAAQRVNAFLVGKMSSGFVPGSVGSMTAGFCYFHDYLLARIGPWIYWDDVGGFVASWRDHYQDVKDEIPDRLSHPDLSASNMVEESGSGKLYMIDNELLGMGPSWILDYRNSFVGKYDYPEPVESEAVRRFIERSWQLRQLSKALGLGEFSRAKSLLSST